MNIYEEMYYKLFNRVTDALESIERGQFTKIKEILEDAQSETEDMFISVNDS